LVGRSKADAAVILVRHGGHLGDVSADRTLGGFDYGGDIPGAPVTSSTLPSGRFLPSRAGRGSPQYGSPRTGSRPLHCDDREPTVSMEAIIRKHVENMTFVKANDAVPVTSPHHHKP
jgi:hypothetical protein